MFLKKIRSPLFFLFLMALTVFVKASSPLKHMVARQTMFQDTIPDGDTADERIFERVEIEASYPGGDEAWRRFLEQTLNPAVPLNYGAPAGTYTVVVQFVVDKEGKISDIKALTNHGYGMEAEVVKILKKAPRWKPAIQDGRFVKAYRKQPVTFMVIDERKRNKRN